MQSMHFLNIASLLPHLLCTYIVLGRPFLELLDQFAFICAHGRAPVAQPTFATSQVDDGGLH